MTKITDVSKIYFEYGNIIHCTKKWSLTLKISSVNITKSAGSWGFSHIYRKNP